MASKWTPEEKAEIRRKYEGLWTDADIAAMQREAESIAGYNGAYAKCVTHNGNNVIIDRKCMADAARSAGLGDAYRNIMS